MPTNREVDEARRVGKELETNAMDANEALIAGTGKDQGAPTDVLVKARDQANMNMEQVRDRFKGLATREHGGDSYDFIEPSDPAKYGR